MTSVRIFSAMAVAILVSAGLYAQSPSTSPSTGPAATSMPASGPAAQVVTVVQQSIVADGIVVSKLSNGLSLIVKAHRAAPVVSVRCYVHTGSIYEREWLGCGLSHLLEHLVANGEANPDQTNTRKLGSQVSKIGGQYNAFTSMDCTSYYVSAAAGKTIEAVDIVAQWMVQPEITQADFDREHGVVQRELELYKDQPDRVLYHQNMAVLYGNHPAGIPIIGLAGPLRDVTIQDVLDYHKRMYVPQNMVFCVVGDVDVQAVIDRVCRDFAPLEEGRGVDLNLPAVCPITQTTRGVCPMPKMKESIELASFLTTEPFADDEPAADILGVILGGGESSRLYAGLLRDQKLVTQISAYHSSSVWGRGAMEVSFRCRPDKVEQAQQAMLEQIKKITESGVTAEEIQLALSQFRSDLVHTRQSVETIASDIARGYLLFGDVCYSENYFSRLQAVTAQQVQDAARRYLDPQKMVVSLAVPQETYNAAAAASQKSEDSQAEFFTLPNGLRVVLKPVPNIGMSAMVFATRGGLMLEDAKCNGIGGLMVALSTKGAGKWSATDISTFFDSAGGSIGAISGYNSFVWQADCLDGNFDQALDIFSLVITQPAFSQPEMDILRPQALSRVVKADEDFRRQLGNYFRKEFFPGTPYAMPPDGTRAAVEAITTQQIAQYHKDHILAGDSVLAIYGSFDAAVARKKIEQLFAALPAGRNQIASYAGPEPMTKNELRVLASKNVNAGVVVAVPSTIINDLADNVPINVLDTIISGWGLPGGWIFDELRGKQLVYSADAYNWPGLMPGAFMAVATGEPKNVPQIIEVIQKNLQKATTYTPSDEEVSQAVNTILTSELLNNQSMAALAFQTAQDELNGLGYDYRNKMEELYRKVTPEDVRRAAEKFLGQNEIIVVTTPKPELVEQATSMPTSAPAAK
jgi:zinc protease